MVEAVALGLAFSFAPGRSAAEVEAEELHDDPVEMTNLRERHTGVPGVISISTRQGQHGPRIKWFPQRACGGDPFLTITLDQPPRLLNHGVSPRDATGAVAAAQWAEINRDALLHFWSNGTVLDIDEIADFTRRLKRLD